MSALSVLATRDTSSTHAAGGAPLSAGRRIERTIARGCADATSMVALTKSREAGRESAWRRGNSAYVPNKHEFSWLRPVATSPWQKA